MALRLFHVSKWVGKRTLTGNVFILLLQQFLLAVVSALSSEALHQNGGECVIIFFEIIFFNLRWGLRITPGLTLLSALLVLFFLYDPPRSSLPFLIFFATLQGRPRLPENLFSMQKGAKARGKRRRLLSARPGCKTSNIFSPSKVSSSTLSVRLTLWYKFPRITFFRFYLCHLHYWGLGLLRPSLLWDWNRLSCKRLPWLWPRTWALWQGLCQLCHRSYHCWSRCTFFFYAVHIAQEGPLG